MEGDSPTTRLIHEVKGPVMAVRGLAQTGSRRWDDLTDEERREFLSLIDSEAGRLVKIIEQVSIILRLEVGEFSFSLRDQPFLPMLEDALAERAPARETATNIAVDEGATIRCDREVVQTILRDAIDNAVRFSPEGSTITIDVEGDDDRIECRIRDQGPGLRPEDLAHAFDRCTAVRPPGYEAVPGAGLSLHLARVLAQAQGGTVALGPAGDDGGTIITLTLPRGTK